MSFYQKAGYFLGLVTLSVLLAHAGGNHGHGKAHIHGLGQMYVVIEKDRLQVQFEIPADDILGFEHMPKSEEEKSTAMTAVEALKEIPDILKISENAKCGIQSAPAITSTLLKERPKHKTKRVSEKDVIPIEGGVLERRPMHSGGHGHGHGHDHGHSHGDHEVHSEFRIVYRFICKEIEQLKEIKVLIFKKFPRMQRLKAQSVWNSQFAKIELTPQSNILSLKKN